MSRNIRNKEYQNDEFHFPSLLLNNFFFLGKYHTKVKNTLLHKSRHDIILTNVYSKLSNVVEKYKGSKKDSRHIIFRKSQETLQGNTWVEWDTKKNLICFRLETALPPLMIIAFARSNNQIMTHSECFCYCYLSRSIRNWSLRGF